MTTERNRQAAAALFGAGAGSLATLLLKTREAKAAPEGVDQALWDMLASMVEAIAVQSQSLNSLTISVDNLIRTLGGSAPSEEDPFENTSRFVTGQVICTVLNQGFQLPSFPIPKNKQLVVKALPANIGWISLSITQSQSQDLTTAYMLVPNEGVGLFIQNSNQVWACAPPAPIGSLNDGIAFIVEQD